MCQLCAKTTLAAPTWISLLLGSSLNANVVVTAAVAVVSGRAKEGRSTVMLLTTSGSRMKSWPDTIRDIITKENKMKPCEVSGGY